MSDEDDTDVPDDLEDAAEAADADYQGFIDPVDKEAMEEQSKSALIEEIVSIRAELDQLRNEMAQLARPLNRAFFVKVTGASAWGEKAYSGSAWVDYQDGRTGSAALIEMKSDSAGYMTLVIEDRDNGSMVYVRVPMLGTPVFVTLSSPSGSNGNQTTAPNWTYTVATIAGDSLGAGFSPTQGRCNGSFAAATRGMGYFDNTGTFVLVLAFETPGTSAECPPPE